MLYFHFTLYFGLLSLTLGYLTEPISSNSFSNASLEFFRDTVTLSADNENRVSFQYLYLLFPLMPLKIIVVSRYSFLFPCFCGNTSKVLGYYVSCQINILIVLLRV